MTDKESDFLAMLFWIMLLIYLFGVLFWVVSSIFDQNGLNHHHAPWGISLIGFTVAYVCIDPIYGLNNSHTWEPKWPWVEKMFATGVIILTGGFTWGVVDLIIWKNLL